jgi:hypothetical protein
VSNALGDWWPKRAVGRKSQRAQDATNIVVYIALDLSRAVDSPPIETHCRPIVWFGHILEVCHPHASPLTSWLLAPGSFFLSFGNKFVPVPVCLCDTLGSEPNERTGEVGAF